MTSAVREQGYRLPLAATLVAMFTLQMSNLAFAPLLPSLQSELSMSFTQLGLFTGIYGLLAIALSVPAGLAAKHFGEKHSLAAGLLVVALGNVLLSTATDFGEALAWRTVTITGYRFAFVCVLVAIAVTAPQSLKGRAMGLTGAMSALASVIGAPVGGYLVRALGWRQGILGYAAAAAIGALVFALLYRRRTDTGADAPAPSIHAPATSGGSAFKTPLVWMLALMVGLGGFGQFTVTYFVPSIGRSLYGLDSVATGWIISVAYMFAIVVNLLVGVLMDRHDKWKVLGGVFALVAVASATLTIENLLVFRVATAAVIGLGFTAVNQLYGMAGSVIQGRETGASMGVVSLGAGLFGYFGPQMLGLLRDWTGGFAAGFYMVAIADLLTLGLIIIVSRSIRRQPFGAPLTRSHAQPGQAGSH